jgi:thymidine kinase
MSLDIIIGPMFAGKSSRILDLASQYQAIGSRVLIIKHASDRRYAYSEDKIVTHGDRRANCAEAFDLHHPDLIARIEDHDIIIVDEAQFFTYLVAFCEHVVDTKNKKLYLIGLDGDSNRRKFGEILDCIPLADRVERLTALCRRCANGTPGLFSRRRSGHYHQQVIVGGAEMYETLCRECYLRGFSEEPRPNLSGK